MNRFYFTLDESNIRTFDKWKFSGRKHPCREGVWPTLNYSSAPNRNSVRFKIAGSNAGGGVYQVQYDSSYGANTYTVKQVFDNVVLDLVSSWVVTITAKSENSSKGDITVDGLNASGGRQYFNGSKVRLERINKGGNLFAGFYINNTTQTLEFANNAISNSNVTAILRGHVTVMGMFRSGYMQTPREVGIPYLANDRGAREITSRANHKLTGYATGSTVKLSLKASPNEFPNRFLVMYGGNVLLDTGMHGTKGPGENYKDPTSGGLEWTNKVSKVANGLTYNIDFVKRAGVDTVQVWVLEYEGIDDRNTWTYTWSYELKKR